MERYGVASRNAKLFTKRFGTDESSGVRFAFVGNEPFIEPERFAATVAVNRGVQMKATTDLQEALDWLNI